MLKSITCLLNTYFKPHLLVLFFSFHIFDFGGERENIPKLLLCCCQAVTAWQRDSVTRHTWHHVTTISEISAAYSSYNTQSLSLWSVGFFNLDIDTTTSKHISEKVQIMETWRQFIRAKILIKTFKLNQSTPLTSRRHQNEIVYQCQHCRTLPGVVPSNWRTEQKSENQKIFWTNF